MLNKNSIGIDIGHNSVAIVWLQSRFKGYTLMEHRVFPLSDSEAKPDQDKHAHIAALITTFISENDITSPEIYLSVPGERTVIRDIVFPLAVKENFRDTIRFEMEKYVPFSSDHIYHDCHIINEDKNTKQLTILLVVIKKDEMAPYLQLCDQLDWGVSGIEITPTAMANGLSLHPSLQSTGTFTFIYQEEKKATINLINNKNLLSSRTVSVDMTDASLSDQLAHELKICRNNNLLAGKRLPVFVDQENSIPARTEDKTNFELHGLDLSDTVPAARHLPAFGPALRGIRNVPGQINLMPIALRKKPDRRAITVIYGLIALNLILLMTWSGSLMMHRSMTLKELAGKTAQLTAKVKDLPDIEKNVLKAEKRITFLNHFQHGQQYALDIIMELTAIIPDSVWIEHFQLRDRSVQIDGFAESASDLISILESSSLFHEVAFVSTISKGKDDREHFKIRFALE